VLLLIRNTPGSNESALVTQFNDSMIATLPHPGTFVAGNLRFLSVGLRVRSQGSSGTLGCFGQILMLCVLPLLFLYSVEHLIVICPFAYIGCLFSSAIVESRDQQKIWKLWKLDRLENRKSSASEKSLRLIQLQLLSRSLCPLRLIVVAYRVRSPSRSCARNCYKNQGASAGRFYGLPFLVWPKRPRTVTTLYLSARGPASFFVAGALRWTFLAHNNSTER
jgi:hypothetical protein